MAVLAPPLQHPQMVLVLPCAKLHKTLQARDYKGISKGEMGDGELPWDPHHGDTCLLTWECPGDEAQKPLLTGDGAWSLSLALGRTWGSVTLQSPHRVVL